MQRILAISTALILVFAGTIAADWEPSDGHKMHFPQMPADNGMFVQATFQWELADDWVCSETGPIKSVHFWGGWEANAQGILDSFLIRIHSDNGLGVPDLVLWEKYVTSFTAFPYWNVSGLGWYQPSAPSWTLDNGGQMFQYNVFLDEPDWFLQDSGTVYWLSISAFVADSVNTSWGWRSSADHFGEAGAWSVFGSFPYLSALQAPHYDYILGDVNGDLGVNIDDVIYLINFLQSGGAAPQCDTVPGITNPLYLCADTDGDCDNDLSDASQIELFLFQGTPMDYCPDYPPTSEAPNLDLAFVVNGDPDPICGDINGDGSPNPDIADLVYFISWMFSGGPAPPDMMAANVGGCEGVNMHDLARMRPTFEGKAPFPYECDDNSVCPGEEIGEVSLTEITGFLPGGEITTGQYVKFGVRMTNPRDYLGAMTIGLRVYSLSGTEWGETTVDTANIGLPSYFDMVAANQVFSNDGMGADTVAISTYGLFQTGFPAGFDEVTHEITIGPISRDFHDGTICIDSSWYPPAGEWIWSYDYWPDEPDRPAWGGPYCWEVTNCCRVGGNVDYSDDPIPDIADLVYLTDYMFQQGPEPICFAEADIDGSDDKIYPDIKDLVHLVDWMFNQSGVPPVCPGED